MPDPTNPQDLQDRLTLIESMIAEGRHQTGSWGWAFVLWGVAYCVAIGLSSWTHSPWSWPATILVAILLTVFFATRQALHGPNTTLGRAVGSVWLDLGVSMCVLFLPLGFTGRLADPHLFPAIVCGILGLAHGASALIVRWKIQFACALLWWAAAVLTCFGTPALTNAVFLVAIFVGQIVFGLYATLAHAQHAQRQTHV
jgi:hypothetical protein